MYSEMISSSICVHNIVMSTTDVITLPLTFIHCNRQAQCLLHDLQRNYVRLKKINIVVVFVLYQYTKYIYQVQTPTDKTDQNQNGSYSMNR